MKIKSLAKVKGHLIKVTLTDESSVFIERDYAAELCLKEGGEIDNLTEILKESEYRRAKSRALWFLDRADRTEKVLCEKITSGGISKEAALRAVSRLKELGVVSDRRYAENFAERMALSNMSVREINRKLYAKGVPADIIKQVLGGMETDEKEQIKNLIIKKYRNKLNAENGVQKTVASLMRKGFSYSKIRDALKEFETETEFEEDFYV